MGDAEVVLNLFTLNIFMMIGTWVIVCFNKRAGLVDVVWSFSIALNVIIAAVLLENAPIMIRIFIGLFTGAWFLRLTWHLLRRYLYEEEEDTRYSNMRRAMGNYQHLGFLVFFLFQAGLVLLFSFPMLKLLSMPIQLWSDWTFITVILAAVIMLVALVGESVADQQLYHFKLDPSNKGKTMDQGLWKYSRHPNYFFEWLHWFAYPLLGLAVGLHELWIYPLLMWLFLYYITGIPFSEQQALLNRGDNYKEYQKRTSIFIPWQPKK